jgi:hypothetical protein
LPDFVAVYVPDSTLTLPPDDQPIWRYVTFTKMVALLLDPGGEGDGLARS